MKRDTGGYIVVSVWGRSARAVAVAGALSLAAVGLAAGPAWAASATTTAGSIRVVDGDGAPLVGAGVIITSSPFGPEYTSVTGADGRLALTDIPGFEPAANPYAVWVAANGYSGYWDRAGSFEDTTLVQIQAGAPTIVSTIEATNPPPDSSSAGISGTVTDALTSEPVLGVQVGAVDVGTGGDGGGNSQSVLDGTFYLNFHGSVLPTLAEVTFQPWTATASAPYGYARQLYDRENGPAAAGTPFTVTAGQTVTGIDAALMPNGLLTGVVAQTGADADVPLQAQVSVWDVLSRSVAFSGSAASDGSYAIPVLPGKYVVQFDKIVGGEVVSSQYYNGSGTYEGATPVEIRAKQVTGGIDARFPMLAAPSGSPSPTPAPTSTSSPTASAGATLPATGATSDTASLAWLAFATLVIGAVLVATRRVRPSKG